MVCCPHGGIVTLPILASMAGVALTFAYAFSCHFYDSAGSMSLGAERGYGPWTVQGTYPVYLGAEGLFPSFLANNSTAPNNTASFFGGNVNLTDAASALSHDAATFLSDNHLVSEQQFCYPWSQYGYDSFSSLFDRQMNAARGLSMAAVVLSVLLMFTMIFMACCRFRKCSFYFTGFLSILTGLLSAATFISFSSEYCQLAETCKLGYSGIVCIVAAVWWVALGIFLCSMEKAPVEERRRQSAIAPSAPREEDKTFDNQAGVVTTNAGRDVELGQNPRAVVVY